MQEELRTYEGFPAEELEEMMDSSSGEAVRQRRQKAIELSDFTESYLEKQVRVPGRHMGRSSADFQDELQLQKHKQHGCCGNVPQLLHDSLKPGAASVLTCRPLSGAPDVTPWVIGRAN